MKAGYVYILHFLEKYKHARHYIGYAESPKRLYEHLTGIYRSREPKLLKAVREAGIEIVVATSMPGDRELERRIKNVGHADYYCPLCRLEREIKRLQNKYQNRLDLFSDEVEAMLEAKRLQHLSMLEELKRHANFIRQKGEKRLKKVA